MIDLNRLDITKPIDLSTLCNTGLYSIKPEDKHFGVNLVDEVRLNLQYLNCYCIKRILIFNSYFDVKQYSYF